MNFSFDLFCRAAPLGSTAGSMGTGSLHSIFLRMAALVPAASNSGTLSKSSSSSSDSDVKLSLSSVIPSASKTFTLSAPAPRPSYFEDPSTSYFVEPLLRALVDSFTTSFLVDFLRAAGFKSFYPDLLLTDWDSPTAS